MTRMSSSVVVRQRNIERLIARCESIISGKTQLQGKDWKLPKVWPKPISLSCLERVIEKGWISRHKNFYVCFLDLQYVAALDEQISQLEKFER